MAWRDDEILDECPICNNPFKSEKCPHSYRDVNKWLDKWFEDKRIREVIREEIHAVLADEAVKKRRNGW